MENRGIELMVNATPIQKKDFQWDITLNFTRARNEVLKLADGVKEFSQNPYALTLLLTGLAEIHSNCQMFGGFDSTSFKIKFKCISQRGKQIINLIKNKK
jgi:hypothetical protein